MLAAFLTGLVGSLHCLGMCGPIALSLPVAEQKGWGYFAGRVLYNFGRLFTYSVLGGLVAMLGVAAALFDVQRYFSLGLGAVLIVLALFHFGVFGKKTQLADNFLNRAWRRGMGRVMRIKGAGGMFVLGLMNGILPCGLVYAGLFLAANSATAWEGSIKMAAFGLGTMPLMLTLTWSGGWIRNWLRLRARLVMPVVMTFLGLMFVLRGMALGIPYVSPRMEAGSEPGKVKMSCCEKMEGGKASNPKGHSPSHKQP
ncbi:MAG: sulfite exporter TauE/SafE family protein [Bacteroidia bacterium]